MATPYIGEIRLVPFTFAPQGWAFCQGQLLSIAENATLFSLIGTTYGGDGQQTFALPNLQSRVPIHMGNGFVIGEPGGVETVTLTSQQTPTHTHAARCKAASANQTSPAGNYWGSWADNQFSDQTPNAAMNGGAVGTAGSTLPHDNMVPFLVLNFIISLFGIFPSQN